jgi:tetratricopeptide (TPR) repeat protein
MFVSAVCLAALPLLKVLGGAQTAGAKGGPPAASGVRIWEEETVIPTYAIGDPEPNPMFYFGGGSQGAQGRVYPYPLYDNLTFRKEDKKYKIAYLENEFVRIGILPEVGGRLFEALDKTNNYNFIYRQHVIKPALIGLIGAWISGGIEWNIPHHHRATSALPVQYKLEDNPDGSKTIWVGELEVRSRMRWAVGYTLRPGKSYMEAKVRIMNRTPVVETMLCFANVAVSVNENYQTIYPPATQFGTYHGKNQFTHWPVSHERYSGADFTQGVDISWYKNHISSNSIFAWNYEDDFFGGYDHGKKAGIVSYADHHVIPGKKMWTWGNGPAGRAWDHILTDEDGPYEELMVGAYSDNQPDYSWLQPYETKSFSMYWYPFRDIDGLKNANLDAAVNLDVTGGNAKFGFYTTAIHPAATVSLKLAGKTLVEEKVAIGPAKPYMKTFVLPAGADEHDLRASISADGKELVAYTPIRKRDDPLPPPVTPYVSPDQIKTNEELYLTGLRIEQFNTPGATDPVAYWQEALRRDPGDVRVNTALGINYFKKARFAEAERLFRKALERATDKYTSPKDGEATYYLGLTLKAEGKFDEAYESLEKATWSLAWRGAAYYETAEIAAMRGDLSTAADLVERSLQGNGLNMRALTLKAAVLRNLGRTKEALEALATARRITDPLDARLMAEQWLATKSPSDAQPVNLWYNRFPALAQETAAEMMHEGLWKDGSAVLAQAVSAAPDAAKISPMVYYYLAYFAAKSGQEAKAGEYRALAARMPPDYVFPFQYEEIDVLRAAIDARSSDARAPYYLGNLLYDWQPAEATKYWESSVSLDPAFAIAHRNLAIAYEHRGDPPAQAIAQLEKAVSLDRKYPIHFTELDQLYEATGADPQKRLALLERNQSVVNGRDDALAREISLKVLAGEYDQAIQLMSGRHFAVAEGANLNVAEDWTNAHLLRGERRAAAKHYREALADFQAATVIPDNLPASGRGGGGAGGGSAESSYWIGAAYEGLGNGDSARQAWTRATTAEAQAPAGGRGGGRGGGMARGGAMNAAQSYYRALALQKLGQADAAKAGFQAILTSANQALQNPGAAAPATGRGGRQSGLPGPSPASQAHYAAALGHLGLGETDQAKQELKAALVANPANLGARSTLDSLK